MASLLNPNIELLDNNPEVKSYIYQQISEFEPFVTPETVIAVLAKDPEKLALQYETDGKDFDSKKMREMYRIAISLSEGKSKIHAEAIDGNVFTAIRMAKENLIQKLVLIQDSVVTQQERQMEINHFLQNPVLH